jgi:hypothetical protein
MFRPGATKHSEVEAAPLGSTDKVTVNVDGVVLMARSFVVNASTVSVKPSIHGVVAPWYSN